MLHLRRLGFLCFLLPLLVSAAAAAEPYEHPYPEALQISVETEVRQADGLGAVSVEIPVTGNEAVTHALSGTMDGLLAQMAEYADCRIDTLSTYRISGTRWAGFLLTARAVTVTKGDNEVITVEDTAAFCYNVQTYDMETGEALTLADVFSDASNAWPMIGEAARELLYSYYPGENRDEITLDILTSPQALAQCAFLPCAGQLLVPFSLAEILPEHPQIAWLKLPYPDYRALMRPQAMLQTDNSSRPMIALTMDDGPTRINTEITLTALARYGASSTFFCVGNAVVRQPDLVRRELDLGHAVAAHSMTHTTPSAQSKEDMLAEYDEQRELFQSVTGIPVTLLRPPGGDLKTYVYRQVGWPLIRWTKSISDTGDGGYLDLASRIKKKAEHGDIFLMHDTKEKTALAVPYFLENLQERGFMFATVEELLYLNGVTPQPNVGYYDGLGVKTYPKSGE